MTRNRRGSSLIELTVTLSILSVVLTLVGKTMVLLMRSERAGGKAIVASHGLTRLANRFRRDVHEAEKSELIAEPNAVNFLRLTRRDGTVVEYRPRPDGMVVATRRGKTRLSREFFRLQGVSSFVIDGGPRPVVTLIHVPDHGRIADSKPAAGNDKQIRVEAVRGVDRRFATPARRKPLQ
jgi:prepilin-type N-terminal cleavage/methylation domain-containing protein